MLTHYPNVIRRLGPVVHGWMMRYEAKHKQFTSQAHSTNNFINITKSLAYQNQEFAAEPMSFEININPAKKKTKLTKHSDWNEYTNIFQNRDVNGIYVIEFLHYNSVTFRKGVLFLKADRVHRIKLILQDKSEFLFICQCFSFEKSTISTHSFKINEDSSFQCVLLHLNDLNMKTIVDEVVLDQISYFIADKIDKLK